MLSLTEIDKKAEEKVLSNHTMSLKVIFYAGAEGDKDPSCLEADLISIDGLADNLSVFSVLFPNGVVNQTIIQIPEKAAMHLYKKVKSSGISLDFSDQDWIYEMYDSQCGFFNDKGWKR